MDKHYQEFYQSGISYFELDLSNTLNALNQSRCVALSSAYKMGDRRFVDYLAYVLGHKHDFMVYYDREKTFTAEKLLEIQDESTAKQKVLLLPWYFRMDDRFKNEYLRLMRNRTQTFLSVIVLEADFLDHPEKYFLDTNTPIDTVMTRKMLVGDVLQNLIDARSKLDGLTLNSRQLQQVAKWSGGHIGLVKRLGLYVSRCGTLDPVNAIIEPNIRTDLLNLELQLRSLTEPTLHRIGLRTTSGSIAIPLLEYFVTSIAPHIRDDIHPDFAVLLDAFEQKNNHLLSLSEIHSLVFKGKALSLWAVYKFIARFEKAIAPQFRVKNVKGKGYQLTLSMNGR